MEKWNHHFSLNCLGWNNYDDDEYIGYINVANDNDDNK
jgi:hypothetical protein